MAMAREQDTSVLIDAAQGGNQARPSISFSMLRRPLARLPMKSPSRVRCPPCSLLLLLFAAYTSQASTASQSLSLWDDVDLHGFASKAKLCLGRNTDTARELMSSCSRAGSNSSTRERLVRVLCCISDEPFGDNATVPVRVLTSQSTYSRLMAATTAVYSELTGIPIKMDAYPIQASFAARVASIRNAADLNQTHEAWITSSSSFGDGYAQGVYKDLTRLIEFDKRLKWEGIMPNIRLASLMFKGQVLALPLSATTYHLAYRKDVFAKYNLTVPRTWKDLVTFAAQVNGTDSMYSFCGLWSPCFQLGSVLIRYILATYVQTHGATQGWLFEPNSMSLMLKSSAMKEVLEVILGLYKVSPPDMSLTMGCPPYGAQFTSGQCLMAIVHPATFKYTSHISSPGWKSVLRGNLGMAPWPGSDRVLDVATDTLVPCDLERCPYASRQTRQDGTTYYLNESPGQEVVILAINSHASEFISYFTFSALSYVTSPDVSRMFAFHPESEVFPVRASLLDPDLWLAAGFEYNNTVEFCQDAMRSLQHPNIHTQFAGRGSSALLAGFSEVAQAMLTSSKSTTFSVDALGVRVGAIFKQVFGTNLVAVKQDYWQSINRVATPRSLPNTSIPVKSSVQQSAEVDNSLSVSAMMAPVSIFIALAAVKAVKMLAEWHRIRRRQVGRRRQGQVWHSGPGRSTTLLVTDIENSTLLWEKLDPAVVDAAVKLHNACLRNLAAEHLGYESVWEGDSFIIAFPAPKAALEFAVQAQLQLMKLDWPAGLLASELASEVWAVHSKTGKRYARAVTSYFGGLISNTLSQASHSDGRHNTEDTNDFPGIPAHVSDLAPGIEATVPTSASLLLRSQWKPCPASTPGAVCLYKGLRVRIGMHAGVASHSDIQFNSHMRRFHYTGPARVISNAVASAGHGGSIMLSGATARLLGMDAAGVLTDLPSNSLIYHMGTHILSGVEDATDLLMVLPAALKGRLAVQQEPLRSVKRLLPGILDAPVASRGQHHVSPTAVAIKVASLSTLLYWNAAKTAQAMRSTLACLHDVLSQTGGYLVEDGLTLVLTTGKTKVPVGASFPDITTPGRLMVMFTSPSSALQFSLRLRGAMANLDWGADLLQHELCEPVGRTQDQPASGSVLEFVEQDLHIDLDEKSSICSRQTSIDSPTQADSTLLYSLGTPVFQAALAAGKLSSSAGPLFRLQHKLTDVASPKRVWFPDLDTSCMSIHDEQDASSVAASSDIGNVGIKSKPAAGPAGNSTIVTKGNVRIIKPYMLRGLRTRTAVVQGPVHIAFAVHSSGRAVYTGKPIRQLAHILDHIKAGEVAVQAHVFDSLRDGS